MASSAVRAVAFALLLQSTCWIGVWAQLHNIITEGGEAGEEHTYWDYSDGWYGPANWHNLDPKWGACAGTMQSPLHVYPRNMVTDPWLGPLDARYNLNRGPTTISKRDHDIEVTMPKGSGNLIIDGEMYELESFHYHMPSEHRILNHTFPLELHLKHKRAGGSGNPYAVVSFLFVYREESKFWNQLPLERLASLEPKKKYPLGFIHILSLAKDYGRYEGSLTAPPCTESVKWIINLWNFPPISKRQVQLLQNALPTAGHKNNQPSFSSTRRGFRTSNCDLYSRA